MKRSFWNFCTAARLLFGNGAVRGLGLVAQRLKLQRIFLITDPALINAGVLDPVKTSLTSAGIEVQVFDGGEPEPSLEAVESARKSAHEFQPDGILGLGGGSNMDLAKTTAMLLAHGGNIRDYIGYDEIPGPVLPLICLPTTSGTGSEVSSAAVLTDHENKLKIAVLSPYLRPTVALVDPELTVTCPKGATAASGIDALTHAIEAYLATAYSDLAAEPGQFLPYEGKHLLGDCLAERAIRLIAEHLVTAVNEPDNLEARHGMALGATIAGMSFSNCGVGLVHAMEYPLGGTLHVSHGEGNGLLLPHVMRYELPARVNELVAIHEYLGGDNSGLSSEAAANGAIAKVEALQQAIGIRTQIRELGGTEEHLSAFAAKAFSIKRLMDITPRDVTEADILEVYRAAY